MFYKSSIKGVPKWSITTCNEGFYDIISTAYSYWRGFNCKSNVNPVFDNSTYPDFHLSLFSKFSLTRGQFG